MKYRTDSIVVVEISVEDGSDAITRVTGPNGDEWRSHLYDMHEESEVIEMWADNCICNGVGDANRLDGWADLKDGEVTMRIRSTYTVGDPVKMEHDV